MDFILSLTHFCEVHGPTSILCSQVAPTSCPQCDPDSRDLSPNDTPLSSHPGTSPSSNPRDPERDVKPGKQPITASSVGCASSGSLEPLASPTSSAPASTARIEDHPWFLNGQYTKVDTEKFNCFGGAEGDTCASCRLSIPEDISKQLPPGAPGTLKENGRGRNGSPVLRSREIVHTCHGSQFGFDDASHDSHVRHSNSTSVRSSYSSESSCHTHIVTYLSMRGPPNPTDYSLLRRASIRTLSCEFLPRGLSSGPLSFGDTDTGYTIAYVFRLPDPMARGKRRSYALVALAGRDAGRAFRASPVIWRVFSHIANNLVSSAEKSQEHEKRRDVGTPSGAGNTAPRNYTPISSFLTGRTVDPDGQPRRAGQIRARNLAEIVGNEYIFAELHAQFVALLQQLGAMFGGSRIPENRLNPEFESEETEEYFPRRAAPSIKVPIRPKGARGTSNSGMRCDSPNSPGQHSPVPKPIPISHRRHYAA
ncbi:uncharacterized protein CIMG_01881 [Coccidioides immitis RS]|uniref:UDENN FLCN/SMCR8-type domain-containing protein n=2 Tax=Coccidioides immitis TaxID=5501 RepID=J3KK57_COCIM|nr:uncharacterized protein CIMG_01881 [Coccidioides immitis RS]EAS36527.3 hypothetical protein CIMG_01881 [Coccidioides immitis RS]KMP01887.1 hypothetical protein CIRG_02026 [Coccidioides immitis RMSCC 2394]TPX25361.1 hypothetical protein DIZ76_010813 [Coccidioides immitis]